MGKTKTSFVKGQKVPKKPNKPNRKTLILETFAQTIVEGGMEKFKKELMSLKGQSFVYAYTTIFEFVKPKLARTELKGDLNVIVTPINIKLPDGGIIEL